MGVNRFAYLMALDSRSGRSSNTQRTNISHGSRHGLFHPPPFSFIPLPPICKKRDLSSKRNHFRSFLPGEMLNLACFNTTKYLWDRVTLRVDTSYSSSFPPFPSFSAAECFSSMLPMGREVIRGWSEKWGTNIMANLNVRHLSIPVLDIRKRRGRCRPIPYERSQKTSLGISCIEFLKCLN